IYHFDSARKKWCQADSHHSKPDGSANLQNVSTDTKSDSVLVSRHFYYFGKSAPDIPSKWLKSIDFKNGRFYRVFPTNVAAGLIDWLETTFKDSLNQVNDDPFDFSQSQKRYS